MRGSLLSLLLLSIILFAPAALRADDTRAPHRVSMPARVLRAAAHRPRVAVTPRTPAAVLAPRPAERATFVDEITRSVNDRESF